MKITSLIIAGAILISGCSRRDPIDQLMHELPHETVPSYPFKRIELPATATPEELLTALSKRGPGELGHFDFTSYKISQVRSVRPEPDPVSEAYTAVLLDTNLGRRIVLLRPMKMGWYYRIYDFK